MARSFWKPVRRITGGFTTGTWIAAGWLGLLVLATVTAPALPFDTTKIDLSHRAELPSWRHLLGTTRRGTDMLALIIDGARRSLLVGVGATAIAIVIGATSGLIVAYRKGWLDRFATLAADTLIALPSLAVALVASLILGSSRATLTLLIGVLLSPGVFRTVRAAARAQVGRDYVVAARSLGARMGRILFRELLPNTLIPLIAYGLIVIGIAILIEGALAFLGVAGSPTSSSWGSLIAAGQGALSRSPHLSLIPAFVLIITLVAFTVVGEGIQRDGFRPFRMTGVDSKPATVTARATPISGLADNGLAVRDLRVSYRTPFGPVPVLDGVSFDLSPGRSLAVVGESGSGKSTLIKAILGLMPPSIAEVSGHVQLGSEPLAGRTGDDLADVRGRRIALVMQNPTSALNPMRTIGAQLTEPLRLKLGLSRTDADRRARELLDQVRVADVTRRMTSYPFELSGGMAQRVCVALALTCEPAVLLADEPTSSLDATFAVQILDLIDELRASRGMSLLLVSHSLDLVAQRADDVLVLHAGRVAEMAPAAQLFRQPHMPYTRALLAAVPRLSNPSHTRLTALPTGLGALALQQPGCTFAARCAHADDTCRDHIPPLEAVADRHLVACWHPLDV